MKTQAQVHVPVVQFTLQALSLPYHTNKMHLIYSYKYMTFDNINIAVILILIIYLLNLA